MESSVFIGIDLGNSQKRKSTGLAYLVENNGKPWIESPPRHIFSDDTLIHECIIQMRENFKSMVLAIDG